MKNASTYENPIAQAACVASNLAEMARAALAACEGDWQRIGDGKKGAALVHIEALGDWLDAYEELQQDGNEKAARSLNTTLRDASKKVWETGTLTIQKAQGAYVFALTPTKEKAEKPTDALDKLLTEIKDAASGLSGDEREKFAAQLRAKLGA